MLEYAFIFISLILFVLGIIFLLMQLMSSRRDVVDEDTQTVEKLESESKKSSKVFLLKKLKSKTKKTGKKSFLIFGSATIIVSYGLLLFALKGLDEKKAAGVKDQQEPEKRLSVLPQEKKSKVKDKMTTTPKTQPHEETQTQGPLKISTAVVAQKGRKKQNGVLWVDREISECYINRGKSDDVYNGARIEIYDGETKLGEAKVVEAFDVISNAKLIGKTPKDLAENSYRVIIYYD